MTNYEKYLENNGKDI